jgi:hypothetical protein
MWLYMRRTSSRRSSNLAAATVVFIALFGSPHAAFAIDEAHDEIQVYNAVIAAVGQWTYEQHLNYGVVGQTQPEVPGGFSSNHALQGTPEFAYDLKPAFTCRSP